MTRRPINSVDMNWRINRLERHVIGTEENNWQDGLVVWRANLDRNFHRIRRLLHLWGGGLLAALLASDLLGSQASKIIGAFIGAGH
jgi:hypothetical protein